MNAGPQHVIFGTGAISLATLDALRRRGETARMVNRSRTAPVPRRHRGPLEVHATPGPGPSRHSGTYRTNPSS